jgi:hypothetical protein
MNETQRRFLRCLRDSQPTGLRRSSIPRSCDDLVESMQTCGAVEFRPSMAGRGIVLCITSGKAFDSFITARLPQGLDIDVTAIPDRAAAVALLGNAKAIRHGVGQGVFVRATKPDIVIHSEDGDVSIPVSELTAKAGGSGIQLAPGKAWAFVGDIAVVENADAFWRHDDVLPDVDLAILGSGNMSARLLEWLASPEMAKCHIIHWGDYDPVGVYQYLRLADACPGRVVTYAPGEVDDLLPKYGKRTLVTRQPKYLDQIRSRESDPHVRRMIDLFDKHRRGLEQEVLLRSGVQTRGACP